MILSTSLPTSGEGQSSCPLLPPDFSWWGTDLCCEPEAGRRSSLSPYTWGSRGAPSHSCLPHSHRFPRQLPLAQALVPLSRALGSRVGRRKKRKRRQHPRGLSGLTPWALGRQAVVAGVGGQEEGLQELMGRWKALGTSVRPEMILETTILSTDVWGWHGRVEGSLVQG